MNLTLPDRILTAVRDQTQYQTIANVAFQQALYDLTLLRSSLAAVTRHLGNSSIPEGDALNDYNDAKKILADYQLD